MKLVREILDKHTLEFEDFNYYYVVIEEIEKNQAAHPDICIESCKALIEGVCKTMLERTDTTLSRKNINDFDFHKLYKNAVLKLDETLTKLVSEDENQFEIDFCNRFANFIQQLGEVRNKRSDISHGRAVPKERYSCQKFSRTIKGFTDHIVAYLLEFFFMVLQTQQKEKLDYAADELHEYNDFLDAQNPDFPIEKVKYSKVLFDYEYETYATKYKDFTADMDDVSVSETEKYDIYDFWTQERYEITSKFCTQNNINLTVLLESFEYVWNNVEAIPDNIVLKMMIITPNIEERAKSVSELKEKLKALSESIKKTKW